MPKQRSKVKPSMAPNKEPIVESSLENEISLPQ